MFDKDQWSLMTGSTKEDSVLTAEVLTEAIKSTQELSYPRSIIFHAEGYQGLGFAKEVNEAIGNWADLEVDNLLLDPGIVYTLYKERYYTITLETWKKFLEGLPIIESNQKFFNLW